MYLIKLKDGRIALGEKYRTNKGIFYTCYAPALHLDSVRRNEISKVVRVEKALGI